MTLSPGEIPSVALSGHGVYFNHETDEAGEYRREIRRLE